MDQLRAIKYFIAIAETHSFTEAAKRFNVPPSSLSRRIADLEKHLSATLLQRTTRIVRLTEVGKNYYQQVKHLVIQLETTDQSVKSYHSVPVGVLRISANAAFGKYVILPLLDAFSEQYPQVVIDIHLTDALSKLNRDDVDIAFRSGYAPNERVVAVKLVDNSFYPMSSPQYLEEHGTPTHTKELAEHAGLFYKTPRGISPWLSYYDSQWHDVSGKVMGISNDETWLLHNTMQGKGIVMSPRWLTQTLAQDKDKTLVEIPFAQPINITRRTDIGIFLLYQKQHYVTPKVKVAVDFFIDKIRGAFDDNA